MMLSKMYIISSFSWEDLNLFCALKAHEAKCMADKALETHSSNTFTELETEDMDEVINLLNTFD